MPEQVFVAQPIGIGKAQIIATPFQFEFTGEDRLKVAFVSSVATTVSVALRIIRRDGTIDVANHGFAIAGDRLVNIRDIAVGIGFVSNVVVRPVLSTIQAGQFYVVVFVARGGPTGAFVVIGQMLGGYTTLFAPLAWPGSPITASIDGPGASLVLTVPTPAAGAEWTTAVPVNTRWSLSAVCARFTSGGLDTAKDLVLQLGDGINVADLARCPTAGSTLVGAGMTVTWAKGYTLTTPPGNTADIVGPLPTELLLPPLSTLNSLTFGGPTPTTQWDLIRLSVQEWIQT